MKATEVKPQSMMLMPPPDGHCRICAVKHGPELPHNAESIFYQVRFEMRYKRAGTWADAIAHCTDDVRKFWEKTLRKKAMWTAPAEGVEVIREPIDG